MQALASTPGQQPHRSQFITARGLRHHVLRWTVGDPARAAAQPPLVLLHGWMDVGASFQFLVDALTLDREVMALDWRGFGLTDGQAVDAYWFPDYLADLEAVLDALWPEQAIDLLGHSMGGNIAMSYAGVRPQRIRRLVNVEGFGLPETAPSEAPSRYAKWLDSLKAPSELRPYASLGAVAQPVSRPTARGRCKPTRRTSASTRCRIAKTRCWPAGSASAHRCCGWRATAAT
jgi:pimeloyl-ACP methyl ester carboxylesterase